MEYILCLLLIILCFYISQTFKDALSRFIAYIFVVMWHLSMIGAIASTNLFDPSISTIVLLWLGVLSFIMGFSHKNKSIVIQSNGNEIFEYKTQALLKNKFFIVGVIVFAFVMFNYYRQFFVQLELMGAAKLRDNVWEDARTIYGDNFYILNTFLYSPISHVLEALSCYCLFRYRKWIVAPLLIGLFCFHSLQGGRFGYLYMFVDIIIVYITFNVVNEKIKFNLRYLGVFLLILIGVLFAMSFITSIRSGGSADDIVAATKDGIEELQENIQRYYTGPIVAFDKAITNDFFIERVGGYKFGALLFRPIIEFFWMISVYILHIGFDLPNIAEFQQNYRMQIGPDASFNALYTWNLNYYADFSFIGVLVINFLVGHFFQSAIRLFQKYKTVASYLIVCTLFHVVMFSTMNSNFLDMMYWVLLLVLYKIHKWEIRQAMV